jgi:hypothetical protein
MKWSTLVESQIHKAQAEGQLDDLRGAGKPLPKNQGGDVVSAGLGIMAEAGVLPNEIVRKKAVQAQQELLQVTTDPIAKKAEMRKLADLQMRLAIEQEARRKFYRTTS